MVVLLHGDLIPRMPGQEYFVVNSGATAVSCCWGGTVAKARDLLSLKVVLRSCLRGADVVPRAARQVQEQSFCCWQRCCMVDSLHGGDVSSLVGRAVCSWVRSHFALRRRLWLQVTPTIHVEPEWMRLHAAVMLALTRTASVGWSLTCVRKGCLTFTII